MSIALDVMVFAIIAVTAFIGYKRGFIRYMIKMLGTVACVIVALIVSDMASGPVYNNIVAPRIESSFNGRLQDFDITQEIRAALKEMGTDIPLDEAVVNYIREQLNSYIGAEPQGGRLTIIR